MAQGVVAIPGLEVYSASGSDGLDGGWAQRTATTPDVSEDFRIAWHYISSTSFRGDYAVDTVALQGNSYNFDTDSDSFLRSTSSTSSSTAALSGSEAVTDGTTEGKWNRDSGGTGSGATGPDAAQSGTHYMYCETSGGGNPSKNFWLFSPVITIGATTPLSLSFYESRYGISIGSVKVYVVDTSGNILG